MAHGRRRAAGEIAEQLRNLRERTGAPRIVALQEAFGSAQKAIGVEAGFRYAAFGPSEDTTSPEHPNLVERAYLASASVMHGETEGVWEDSGLAIFSDFPIAWTRRIAFPRFACAGYDCLANKGILAVALRLPDSSVPLVLVDTHLNSRTASGVADGRSLAAYTRQVDLVRGTIDRLSAGGLPVVFAGDFNVGNVAARGSYLSGALMRHDGMTLGASEIACGPTCRSLTSRPAISGSKTLLFYNSRLISVQARGFGVLPDGTRLSDHLGILEEFKPTM